jgi:type IV pilus assembly protein PilA
MLQSSGHFEDYTDRQNHQWGLVFRLSTRTQDPPDPPPKSDQTRSLDPASDFTPNLNAGFTVIELLMVIVIIGVLAGIGIPSMLNQTSKARHAEAKTYIGALNRSQQTFYLENQRFTANPNELDVGVPASTNSYNYSITNLDGQRPGDPQDSSYKLAIVNWAIPEDTGSVRAYLGVVDTVMMESGVGSVESVLCEQKHTGTVNFSGYSSGNNYAVVTTSGDPKIFPACAAPFQGFR